MNSSSVAKFFDESALTVAPRMLGGVLRSNLPDGSVAVRLSEVEAYMGPRDSDFPDPGSHAYRSVTPRNEIMFGPAARLYVYLSYGIHHCLNVVCGPQGQASAVLVRAGEVIEGVELAKARRKNASNRDLASGPGRLAQALGLDLQYNGEFLSAEIHSPVTFEPDINAPLTVKNGPRVGVSGLGGTSDYPWRYWIQDDPTVTKFRAGKKTTR